MDTKIRPSHSRFVIAILIFLSALFIISTIANYSQNSTIDENMQNRKAVGDEILDLSKQEAEFQKQQLEQNKIIIDKLTNLENDSAKSGH